MARPEGWTRARREAYLAFHRERSLEAETTYLVERTAASSESGASGAEGRRRGVRPLAAPGRTGASCSAEGARPRSHAPKGTQSFSPPRPSATRQRGDSSNAQGPPLDVALVSQGQAAVAAEPGDGALDGPAAAAEPLRGFDADAGDPVADAPLTQQPVVGGNVVGLVRVDLHGLAPPGSAPGLDLRDALQEWFEGLGVVEVRRRDRQGKRQAGAVGQDVDLRARLAAIDRVWPGQ
jgi:hypothetical protein